MYEAHYGFRGKPFEIIPDPNFLYLSPNHNNALDHLEYAIDRNSGIILLTGDIGSGKTTLIKYLRQRIDDSVEVAVISNTSMPADQMLSYLLIKLNVEPDENKAYNLHYFRVYLKMVEEEGRRFILVFDEAQNLPKDALEEIRMLSNFQSDERLPLQIFLVGQPELNIILKSPGMNQIRQRIAVNYHLKGLNEEETQKYIAYRLKKAGAKKSPFTLGAAKLIYQASSGIPRSINILSDASLIYGFAEEKKIIGSNEVKNVLSELDLLSIQMNSNFHEQKDESQPAGIDALNPSSEPTAQRQAVPPSEGRIALDRDLVMEQEKAERDKRVLQYVNKKLTKIEFKLDQYRDEFLKATNASLASERKRYEKLLVENTKIQTEWDTLKANFDAVARECEELRKKLSESETNDDRQISSQTGRPDSEKKLYEIQKALKDIK